MKLRVIVEVVDEKYGKGTRRRREIEVPPRVLNVHKALCESRKDLRAFVADDVMSGALAVVSGQQTTTEAMEAALLAEPSPQAQGSAHRKGGKPGLNKLEEFLGLDVIQHMDGLEAVSRQHEKAMAPPPDQAESEFKWGAIGFGPDRVK